MREEYTLGQVVFSKCGRDKGRPFIVISIESEYVHVVDGKLRKVAEPKLKKHKHIQKTNTIIEWIKQKLAEEGALTDSEVRKALEDYLEKSSATQGGL